MEDPGPQDGTDRSWQYPRQEHDRAQKCCPCKSLVEKESGGSADHHHKGCRPKREKKRVFESDAEVFTSDYGAVIGEAHPILFGKQQHDLVEACP
jgi:hypothetical protein